MAKSETGAEASSFDIQAVSRVGQILALYGPQTTELTAVDVAERLGLNRTTAYRYCTSLVTAGILERGPRRGTFILGALMLQLGILALGRRRVVELAPPYLKSLSAEAGMTAVLSLWSTAGPVVALVQEDTTSTIVVTVRAGAQLEITSAQMRVFLAYLPDPHVVDRMTEGLTPAERAVVESDIYAARRTGYSTVNLPGGVIGAAAPVFDEHGICATIALLGADQVGFPPGSPRLTRLVDTAAEITEALSAGQGERVADLR